MTKRRCLEQTAAGMPCRAQPGADSNYCFMHDPEHKEEADDARRLGGQRRKREGTLRTVFGIDGFETPEGMRRVIEVAILENFALPNGVARNRAFAFLVTAWTRAYDFSAMEARLVEVERLLSARGSG